MSRASLLLMMVLASTTASAQGPAPRRVEISPYLGYQFGGTVQSRPGRFRLEDDVSYGAVLDVRVRPDATVQLVYDRQDTVLDFRDTDPLFPQHLRFDVAVEYYHLGGSLELGEERFRPYIALTVGATRLDANVQGVEDEWRASIAFGGGFKTYLGPRIGIRLEGRVWPTFLQTSGGLFCSTPDGCLVSIEGDFVTQGNVTAGVFLAF